MRKFTGIIILILLIIALVAGSVIVSSSRSFDISSFRTGSVYRHLDILTSEEYSGRLTGSSGNEDALAYIEKFFRDMGIDAAGENGTYYQEFRTLVPDVDKEPVFNIISDDGDVALELTMYSDYKAVTSFSCGGIEYTGELIFLGTDLMRINPEILKDKIIVTTFGTLTQKHINYVRDNGGAGLLNNTDVQAYARSRYHEREKDVSNWSKYGDMIFTAYISDDVYNDLLGIAREYESEEKVKPIAVIDNAQIKVDIGFPIVETANILGKVNGRSNNGRTLIISANVDGAGEGTDGRYFPGAISNTTGLALLLETARLVTAQDNLPFETIIFAGWNGQKQQFSGSEYYLEHWLYPPEKTTLIHLEDLGFKSMDGLMISSESIISGIMNDKINNIAGDLGIKSSRVFPYYSPATRFSDYGAQAVLLGDIFYMQDNYYDNSANVDNSGLQNAALVLFNYIKREIYRDNFPDYLKVVDYLIISIIAILLILLFIIGRLNKKAPGMRIGGRSVELIYNSTPVSLIRKGVQFLLPVSIAVLLLVFLANIDPGATVSYETGRFETNFSWYLTIKKTIVYFRGAGGSAGQGIAGTMVKASLRSLALMLSSLAVSSVIGIFSGMFGAYRKKRKNLRSMGSIMLFSIPDVLIVLLGVLLYVLIAKGVGYENDVTILKKFIFPLITLSILPTIYITRMTYIAVQEELKMGYVMNSRAKGYSRKRIFVSEIMPAVAFRTVDALPAIMTMLISNMIIVEYMFNYLGILHYLIYFYNRQNVSGFVAMALIIGGIYLLMTWGIKKLAWSVNPHKRRVVK